MRHYQCDKILNHPNPCYAYQSMVMHHHVFREQIKNRKKKTGPFHHQQSLVSIMICLHWTNRSSLQIWNHTKKVIIIKNKKRAHEKCNPVSFSPHLAHGNLTKRHISIGSLSNSLLIPMYKYICNHFLKKKEITGIHLRQLM